MSCCGNKRAQFLTQSAWARQTGPPTRPRAQAVTPPKVVFQYTGKTAMVVIGPISGRRYRFDSQGTRVEVDPKDRRSLSAVPKLRQV
jgi:hypothetical protein